MTLFSSNRVLGCIAVLALVLIGCNQTGSLNTLSGALEPKSLEFEIQTNAVEAQTNTQLNQTALTRVNLVNGQLQVNTFAAQKTSIAMAVNGSSLWNPTQKAKITSDANLAFDNLEQDINTALDGLPRQMKLTLADHIVDLYNAHFDFTAKNGSKFSIEGLYNIKTTEYYSLSLTFVQGNANQNAALFGLAGWDFKGALNNPLSKFTLGALGVLVLKDVGAISLSGRLTFESSFTRD